MFQRILAMGVTAWVMVAGACSSDGGGDLPAASGSSHGGSGGAGAGQGAAPGGGTSAGREAASGSGGATLAGAGAAAAGTSAATGDAGESSLAGSGAQGAGGSEPGSAGGMPSAGFGWGGEPSEIPLIPVKGWVDGASNVLGIQGAVFADADELSRTGLETDFTGSNACMQGAAAMVDAQCTPIPPAKDCYETIWGAAISMNLNQALASGRDGVAMAFDASQLRGFAFTVSGAIVPQKLRFEVETAEGKFCSPPSKLANVGENYYLFSDLLAQCGTPGSASAAGARDRIVRISWHVASSAVGDVPFSFCVDDVRALR